MDTNSQERARKKAEFSEPSQRKSKSTLILAAVLLVLAGVGAYLVIGASNDDTPTATAVATNPASTAPESRDIRISLLDLSGKAKFFDYKLSDNKPMRFFVIKSPDGEYRAALDACDMCYHAKKGYHQEGEDMICNNCGLHFHSSKINEVHGGCNPIGLPRTIEGNQLVIKASELERRGSYF